MTLAQLVNVLRQSGVLYEEYADIVDCKADLVRFILEEQREELQVPGTPV